MNTVLTLTSLQLQRRSRPFWNMIGSTPLAASGYSFRSLLPLVRWPEPYLGFFTGATVTESVLDRMRDVVLFVAGIIAIGSLILAAFEGLNQRVMSASFLGTLGVVCTFVMFMPKLEVFKVWGVEARLNKTLDRAEEILGKLQRLSLISAKSIYMEAAYGNRMTAPSAKERQAILDEVDQQLADLKVSKAERDAISERLVQVIGFDLYYIYSRVLNGYGEPKNNALIARAQASKKQDDEQAVRDHSNRISEWKKRTQNPHLFDRLKTYSLQEELDRETPNEDEWLSEPERKAAAEFKQYILDLFESCKAKGGYTPEAAAFMDRFPKDTSIVVQERFAEQLKAIK